MTPDPKGEGMRTGGAIDMFFSHALSIVMCSLECASSREVSHSNQLCLVFLDVPSNLQKWLGLSLGASSCMYLLR